MRYADPNLCPDCRRDMPPRVDACPQCGLRVRHRLGVELFATLKRADTLLAELRALSTQSVASPPAPSPAAAATPSPGSSTAPSAPRAPSVTPMAAPGPAPTMTAPPPSPATPTGPTPGPVPPPPRGPQRPPIPPIPPPAPRPAAGLAAASVPKILLGLGALCLLVAAVTFLAVSWSTLGVGGRTAVLAGLTLIFGAGSLVAHRFGLRVAGEALSVVALGLLILDVVGAGAADWFGEVDGDTMTAVAGGIVALAAAAMGTLEIASRPRLVAPQIITGIALLIGYVGAVSATEQPLWTGHVVTGLCVLGVVAARRLSMEALLWSIASTGIAAGAFTLIAGLAMSLEEPNLSHLWLDGPGWSLLASAALMLAPGLIARHRILTLTGASGAAMVVTGVATLPVVDTSAGVFGAVTLAVTAGWAVVLGVVRSDWRVIAMAPAATGSLLLTGQILTGFGVDLARWVDAGRGGFVTPIDVVLDKPDQVVEPAILTPAALVVIVVCALLLPQRRRSWLRSWAPWAAVLVALAATVTLASYDVAVAGVVVALCVTAVGAAAWGASRSAAGGAGLVGTGLAIGFAAQFAALLNDVLTLGAATIVLLTALGAAALARHQVSRLLAGLAVMPTILVVAWSTSSATDLGVGWIAVPALVAGGVVALALPRLEIEISVLGWGLLGLSASLSVADAPLSLLALWLLVLGALCAGSALLHRERRSLAYATPALWLLSSWVWLSDVGVEAPEAYTLPAAVVLVGLGLRRLRSVPAAGTPLALLPGLLLGTIPSLLWVLEDPVSLRALLLGAACLALTLAGAILRWSAPLVVGATVGAVLVLRELGPIAGEIPQWVWIGLAGLILTIVGITWERQLLELRKAVGAIRRLR